MIASSFGHGFACGDCRHCQYDNVSGHFRCEIVAQEMARYVRSVV